MTFTVQSPRGDGEQHVARLPARDPWAYVATLVTVIVFAAGVVFFAPQQSVWVDETTQLSGASLPWLKLIRWLAGAETLPLGVPPDRMPPLSYLIDLIGWRLWGANELAFRVYHAGIAATGIAVLTMTVRSRVGVGAAFATGLLLAMSPKILTIAVEIRAYPIFLAISCLQAAMLLGSRIAEQPMRLIAFLLLGVCGAYTHFFGLVAASACFVAVACAAPDRRAFVRVAFAYGLLLLACSGLEPFISGARTVSDTAAPLSLSAMEIASYPFKLIGNPELLIVPAIGLLYMGGAAAALALGAADLVRVGQSDGLDLRRDPRFGIAITLIAGMGVCVIAAFNLRGFNPLGPRYGIWTFPHFAVLIGTTLVPRTGTPPRVDGLLRRVALVALAIGTLWSALFLVQHPATYTHGPNRDLEGVIARAQGPTAVVHVGPGWGWGYFPLRWRHGETLPQWLLDPSGRKVVRIGSGGDTRGAAMPLSSLAQYRSLVIARIDMNTYRELRSQLNSRDVALLASRSLASLPPPLPGREAAEEIFAGGSYALTARIDRAARIQLVSTPTAEHTDTVAKDTR